MLNVSERWTKHLTTVTIVVGHNKMQLQWFVKQHELCRMKHVHRTWLFLSYFPLCLLPSPAYEMTVFGSICFSTQAPSHCGMNDSSVLNKSIFSRLSWTFTSHSPVIQRRTKFWLCSAYSTHECNLHLKSLQQAAFAEEQKERRASSFSLFSPPKITRKWNFIVYRNSCTTPFMDGYFTLQQWRLFCSSSTLNILNISTSTYQNISVLREFCFYFFCSSLFYRLVYTQISSAEEAAAEQLKLIGFFILCSNPSSIFSKESKKSQEK